MGETEIVRECKVIFLGDGDGGKSSLIDRMVNDQFVPGSLPTDGVKMTKWSLPVNGEDFTLRILDFGGQEIMHSMHRCFLTAHTVYVVVCASRDDTDINDAAARWLETVKGFAPDCPVILALNKADLNPNVSVNERNLLERNPNLKVVLKTSAKETADNILFGVNRLKEAIRAQIPCAVHEYRANPDMIALKTALENIDADTISADDYRKLCEKNHITDGKQQYFLLGFFRDLGVAYYYESKAMDTRLESVRLLNPAWLTNGIYRLILRTEESGFLSHKVIQKTLGVEFPGDISKATYTREETEYILHVMRFFQISLAMRDEQGQETGVELIPMKLPKTPPKVREGRTEVFADEFPKADALHLRWEGAYLPNNLIHRLMIRKFPELDTRRLWRTGAQFRQRGGDFAAMAVMDDNALDVYVVGGRDCRPYLETFRREIQDILNGLNLKPEEFICVASGGRTGRVPFEDVMRQYYDGKEEIYIPVIQEYRNPAELLKETYYHWEQEAAQYRERADWFLAGADSSVYTTNAFSESMKDNPKPKEKAKNKVEIEQNDKMVLKRKDDNSLNTLKAVFFVALTLLVAVTTFSILVLLITGRIETESIPHFLGRLFGILQ